MSYQAAYDLVTQIKGHEYEAGTDKFRMKHETNPQIQLIHAEKIGLGTREYELIDISTEKQIK